MSSRLFHLYEDIKKSGGGTSTFSSKSRQKLDCSIFSFKVFTCKVENPLVKHISWVCLKEI